MRKVIQLAVIPESAERYAAIYAVCDDGTMWCLFHQPTHGSGNPGRWAQIASIPGDAK